MMNSLAIVRFLATFLFVFNLATASPVEKYLLDSTQFQSELNWEKEAFGDSAELPGWKEQSFSQKNGDVWRVHFVCDISSSNPNNWLRLPYIQREQANRLIVKLEYTIRECKKYPGDIRSCKETFQLLYIESDNSTRPPDFSESNYRYLKTIAASNTDINQMPIQMTTQSTASSIYRTEVELPLRTSKQGVYLVFRDQGACVSLLSVKVYYSLCSAQTSNLIEFPETPTGSNATDLVQQTGKCIPNSDLMNNLQQQQQQQPFAYCQTNGNWFMVNDNQIMCSCRPGYYYSKSPQAQCIQCPQGKYKSEASNDQECLACPLNSYTKSNASRFCSCLDGFYRVNSTDFSSGCIQYPDEPKNLTIYYLDQTSIKLRWNQIENADVEYKLDCFKCSQKSSDKTQCKNKQPCESYIKYQPRKDNLTEPRIHLSSLDSNTQYLIELYAQSTRGLFKTKTVDILVRTYEDLLSLEIQNLTVYQFTEINQILLMWSDTSLPKLVSYELRYWPRDDPSKMNSILIKAPAHNFTLKNSNPNVVNLNLYAFQLRAQSQNGWGPFTRPVESVPISTVLYRNQNNPETTYNPTSTYQIISSMISSTRTLASEELNETQTNLTTIIMSTAISLSFFILILSLLIYFKRSNKLNCLSKNISKNTNNNSKNPITSSSSSTHSDCDSLDFAKRAQSAYNQLNSAGGTTSRSSGGSSPVWPPLNSFKTYIDPHTYEDPTRVVGLFAKELSPSNIIIESVIGGGEFGDVCKGCLRTTPWSENVVAIKTLKGAATEQNRCDFLTEASIMAQFKDPNVVRLEGVVTLSHPLMIVTEYMENGSLDSFLRLHENKLKIHQMIKILRDVASGMRYLSDMNYIHRDLAARNILINRDLTCKVADFGLSRALDNDSLEYTTKGGKIPIRWTAPEACNFRKYSYASDVWSYGVLAYEVLSYGERPYWNWENTDVIKAIQESYRLPPPHITPDCLYKLMLRCWNDDRLLRPRFHDIVSFLDEIVHLPQELNTLTRIKELMPINPRQPTQIQLTSTKHFLHRIKLAHYTDVFHKNNLLNLANLFQLDTKDLAYQLNITNSYEQKIILEELKRISECFMNSISTQLNSYITYHQQHHHHFNLNTLHKQQHNTSSIFQLIRTGSINTNNPSNSNSNGADLLMVNSQQTNGFLV